MNRRGFTLVELLVFALLFLLSTAAFGYLLRMGKDSVGSALRLNQALRAVQAEMEEIRALPFNNLPSLNGRTFSNGSGKVLVTPVLADLVKIGLELAWDPKKVPIKLHTLRSKY